MCGIAGVWLNGAARPDRERLGAMAKAIAHRGPDGEGFFIDGGLGLAHRRLAVIDLSEAAAQPMVTDDRRFAIAYNGEIYNFRALREELENDGDRFVTQSDTEVLLLGLRRHGAAFVERLNGMFAFALWDGLAPELILARDRYGIKPLHYAQTARGLAFGSEIKAILASGLLTARLDAASLTQYLTFQNQFDDRSLFSGVRMVPPGTVVRWRSPERSEARTYWDFRFEERLQGIGANEAAEGVRAILGSAVDRSLLADVEIGAYLSGGLDSGTITALSARRNPYLKSFTCGFDLRSASGLELGFDEREVAEHMSYLYRTEHYEIVLKAGDMERVMPAVIRHLEEPRVGQSYPNFFAAKLASRFVKVVLSGTGGDELFAGYPWRYYRASAGDDFERFVDRYFEHWQRLLPASTMPTLLAPVWNVAREVNAREIFRSVFRDHAERFTSPEDYINHSLYFEAKTFLHGLLVVEDKLSMAHGLEARVPFLDNELVDFACALPVRLKLGNLGAISRLDENAPGRKSDRYFRQTRDGKLVLRAAAAPFMPADILERPKQGFSGPDGSWFRGDSIDYVKRTLGARNARIYEYVDHATVSRMLDDHFCGRENRRLFIWSMLCLEHWCREFL